MLTHSIGRRISPSDAAGQRLSLRTSIAVIAGLSVASWASLIGLTVHMLATAGL